jgi:hypothetical protein
MERLAIIAGAFVGAVLRECAPVLVDILARGIKAAMTSTAEESKPDENLRNRLLDRLPKRH